MTLQELKFIVAVAELRHFGKASKKCFISQPSMSIAIQKLEKSLGIKIFERYKNKVLLTQTGEIIVQHAKNILQTVDEIKRAAEAGKNPLAGTLRLGTIFTASPYLVSYLVSQIHTFAPDLTLALSENYTDQLKKFLFEGKLDVLLLAEPFESNDIIKIPLFEEAIVALLPTKHWLAHRDMISPTQFEDENILLLDKGHCFREHVLSVCPECYIGSKHKKSTLNAKTFEGASLETIRHMVASGMGITLLPASAAVLPDYLKDILVTIPLKSKKACRRIILVCRKQFPYLEAMECIKKSLQSSDLKNNDLIEFF